MMPKNRKTLVFLIPAVAVIWGMVIYRVVKTLSEEETVNPSVRTTMDERTFKIEKDTFSLIALDRDPFLGIKYSRKKYVKHKVVSKKEINWPTIEYLGMVSDSDSKSGVYLLNVRGRSHFLQKGDEVDSIKLIKVSPNKIWLKYKNTTRVFQI